MIRQGLLYGSYIVYQLFLDSVTGYTVASINGSVLIIFLTAMSSSRSDSVSNAVRPSVRPFEAIVANDVRKVFTWTS